MPQFSQYYQRVKNVIHAVQALAIFVAWAIIIAILTKRGRIDGRVWYNFALCWCCIPALIYQTASPVFQRIRRFSNAYVHAVIDILFTIFWLAAFACLVDWVKQGSHDAKDWKSSDKLCEKFAWGPVSKCKLGRDAWIVGVIIFLLFAITAAFSVYGVLYYRKNGSSLAYAIQDADRLPIEDHNFSADRNSKLSDHETTQPNHANANGTRFTNPNTEEPTHPSGPIAWNMQQPQTTPAELGLEPVDTSYHSGYPYETSQGPQPRPMYHYPDNYAQYHTHFPNESRPIGQLPTQVGDSPSRHNLALQYDHGGYGNSGRVDFPEGDYSR